MGHAYSALNLRLLLAGFGLLASVVGAVLAFALGQPLYGWILVLLAAVATVNVVVVQRRRVVRRREDPHRHRSIFE